MDGLKMVSKDKTLCKNLLLIKVGMYVGSFVGIHSTQKNASKYKVTRNGIIGGIGGGLFGSYWIGFHNLGVIYVPYLLGISGIGIASTYLYSSMIVHIRKRKLKPAPME